MKQSIGTKILCMIFLMFFNLPGIAFSEGEWAEQNGNIYNTNSGNVGLGTTNPDSILHIDGSGQIRLSRSGDNTWRLFTTNTGSDGLAIRDETAKEYRMFFAEDGKVGIGTTSPSNKLEIVGGNVGIIHTTNPYLLVYDTTNNLEVLTQAFNSYGVVGTGTNHPFSLYTNSTRRLTIDTSGNIGIGTTNPATALHIRKSNPAIRLEETNVRTWDIALDNAPDSLQFRDRTSNTVPFTIGSTGSIGIGTTNPGAKLEVRGGNIKIESSDNYTRLQLWNSGGGRHYQLLSGSNGLFGIYDMTSTDWRLTVRPNGNVGIGTNSPQSKLAVNGAISAKEVKVTNTGWSDFVFEKKYKLPSLNSVASYIEKNKHLPDIPSAKEVQEQGLAVSEMLAKQMQKIEEMTLYLIQLKKENDRLNERVALLEKVGNTISQNKISK